MEKIKVKDKKDGEGLERIIDYSFRKLGFWRRARWANEGFSWKLISALGFGSETICPSREIGEAIPDFHLQVLALHFRGDLLEKTSFSNLRRERAFLFGTWEVLGVFFLSWMRPPFPAACGLLDAEFGIFPSRGTLAGRNSWLVVTCWLHTPLVGRSFTNHKCYMLLVLRGR